ncbi:MAG: bifunctional helix-turn-helix domain-containing protein/methylated-DNA--[protein]-cysteine S-methyltransferase [Pyrinomonadaceae bacterium]
MLKFKNNKDYKRIEKAIEFINKNYRKQPSLEEIAKAVSLSPYHFQRLFTEWAGTSPKKFLQFISIEHAKLLLKEENLPLLATTYELGLSSPSRLHELFVNIEGMTPAEYKHGGKNLSLNFSFADSPFGKLLVASTEKGICQMAFCDDETAAFEKLRASFPNAEFSQIRDEFQRAALSIFSKNSGEIAAIKLHLKGTKFQLKVWEALLKIPAGNLSTYGRIADQIDSPKASRAVGTAIGSNPVAFIIPCHRVIQKSGIFGGYMWGTTRKTAIIGWELAQASERG